MKLRVLDDSIRLRLDRIEVETIRLGQKVEAATHFPGGNTLVYALQGGDCTRTELSDGRLVVTLAADALADWASLEDRISLAATLPLGTDGNLSILVEKDFECLDSRSGEDQSNRFRNPKASIDRK